MTIDDDVEAFRVWATKLGCPSDAMPSEDALKSVFKSRQRDYFCNLMRRVRPRQEVQAVKENILIHKVEKVKGRVISTFERVFLPQEMQTHLRVQDLKRKKQDLLQRLAERKTEYEILAASINAKNVQLINLENKCNVLEAKTHILDLKSKDLDNKIKTEEKNRERIAATMPVVLTNDNKSESHAVEAVNKALKELENFYAFCESNSKPQELQEAKDKLWANLTAIFANLPVFLIFNEIMRLKEDQLQYIMSLSKSTTNESRISVASHRETLTNFEINLMETKCNFLSLVGKYLSACQERRLLEAQYVKAFTDFEDKLIEKVKIFNADADSEQNEIIMRNYVIQYYSLNFNKGKNEYITQQIEALKTEIGNTKKHLENHEVLLGSIKQVYGKISSSVNRLQYDMMQLTQIKDKIIFSKNIMKRQLKDLEATKNVVSNFIPTKLKFTNNNHSLLGVDRFEMSNDNVFCSTKLDFDSTISPLNNSITTRRMFGAGDVTLMPEVQNTILTPHTQELNTFCELPLDQLSCISKECAFYLSPNPLVIESRELTSTIQLAPGILLTPFGALQEVRNRILWADLIAQHSNDLKIDLDTFFVDPQAFQERAKHQHDRIIELLDKIDVCSINSLRSLQKLTKIYDFLIENPLRHFIPSTKLFYNQSYADYEAELLMYTRIATTGRSIK